MKFYKAIGSDFLISHQISNHSFRKTTKTNNMTNNRYEILFTITIQKFTNIFNSLQKLF